MTKVRFKASEFRTAQRCSGPPGPFDCVEVAMKDGIVAVRSTLDLKKKTARFTNDEWKYFVEGVKAGQFDII